MFTITTTKSLKRRLGESPGSKRVSKVQRIMSTLPDRMRPKTEIVTEEKPDVTLQNLLFQHHQVKMDCPSFSDLDGFFHAPTPQEIEAYQHDVLQAVRASQVDTLRQFYQQGRPMKCSNEFGESILHLACRKGLVDVAKFLVNEAKVPVQVCDDYGRNPLHDAVWVHQPNFELMDVILAECPDLLYIKDRRGHTPLSFARRDQWKAWNDYLKSKSPEQLNPTKLLELVKNKSSSNNAAANATAVGTSTASGPATSALSNIGSSLKSDSAAAVMRRPSVATKGITIPTIQPTVAVSGIKIPVVGSSAGLSVLLQAAATSAAAAAVAASACADTTKPIASNSSSAAPLSGPASAALELVKLQEASRQRSTPIAS